MCGGMLQPRLILPVAFFTAYLWGMKHPKRQERTWDSMPSDLASTGTETGVLGFLGSTEGLVVGVGGRVVGRPPVYQQTSDNTVVTLCYRRGAGRHLWNITL